MPRRRLRRPRARRRPMWCGCVLVRSLPSPGILGFHALDPGHSRPRRQYIEEDREPAMILGGSGWLSRRLWLLQYFATSCRAGGWENGMQGKIGLEEHFAIAETLADSGVFLPDRCWGELSRRLLDVQKERIALMDAHGMEMMILSLNAPTVQIG